MLFALILSIFKLVLAPFLPLLGDEAYYSLWSKYLALSYNDHPPMIAYIHWFLRNQFSIRLAAILLLLLASWLVYLITKEAYGKKAALAAVILFNIIPTYFVGGMFLTPEQPLLIFWLLSLYFVLKIVKTKKNFYWYLLGLSIGLGLLSKYPMLLILPGILLFFILAKDQRFWFLKKEPYLATIIALATFSPVIIWNFQQGLSSLIYHSSRVGSPKYFENILYYLILQTIMYSPPLFIFAFNTILIKLWQKYNELDNFSLLFLSTSFPAFAAFLLVSPFTMVGGHWTSIAYLGPIILLAHKLYSSPPTRLRFWSGLITIILINALFVGYYAFLYPSPPDANKINQELPQYIEQAQVDYVFSNQMGVASLVAFYGKTNVHMPQGLWTQFDIWGQPELKPGDDILFFAFADDKATEKLKPYFKTVTKDEQVRIFAKDSNIHTETKAYICKDYINPGGHNPILKYGESWHL